MYEPFYREISQLPPEKIEETLRKLLPPAKLAMWMDGTLFRFSEHGAGLFRVQTVLVEAGIPQDDPRTRMFNGLLGSLIDPAIPAQLHNIAGKQDSLMEHLGAVKSFDAQGRKAWWVPLGVTAAFEQRCADWFGEFEQTRDQLLVDPYREVYRTSRERVMGSAEAAWEDLFRAGKTSLTKDAYLQEAQAIFTARFPALAQIRARLYLSRTPCQAPLPEEVERIYRKLQTREREKETAELEAIRARAQREMKQLELLQLEQRQKQREEDRLKEEQDLRERLIREAVAGEVEQARQVVLQVQSRVIRLCQDILTKVQQGLPVSAATRRSWNQSFRELSALTPDHPHLLEALESMKHLAKQPQVANPGSIAAASRQIGEALVHLERHAAVTLGAEALWQLLQAGKAEEALRRLQDIRGQLTGKLDEVDSLYELMTALGARAGEEAPEEGIEEVA